MGKLAALGCITLVLAGCAGGARESACEVFSPAQIETPATQNDQQIEQNSGQPTGEPAEQRC
ncbi:hypothetical protein ACSVIJ_06630 [Pseudomonas sp. NCHU5208]|uniref:hypothetical protein n=1 Tax=unclassified Pseudomonas TaxID=196821 RepID=UPI00227AA3E8|nr:MULTISPECIES: hypothetical protein [unclassified Pseudomonas]WAJ38048.1 hypothetical protein OU800_02095 [Pseudomonas sp. GOM7]